MTTEKQINSTEIGKHLNLSPRETNKRLKEIGYITPAPDNAGWQLTPLGESVGGSQKKHPQSGNFYIVWKESILNTTAIKGIINPTDNIEPKNSTESEFRTKFPAKLRTTDGHFVRSRAELLIDNWLYMAEIVHAYERKLPIEEEVYCDFYLPSGKVYIEFWGLENDAKYLQRKETKINIYKKYNFSLIEIHDTDLENLDDFLPGKLLLHGIKSY